MRWIAGGLIILGCGYLGISFAGTVETRIRQLMMLEQMFRQLEFNIVFLARPFSEGLKSAASSYQGSMSRLFSKVADHMIETPNISPESAFRTALDDINGVWMKVEEQEILGEFFRHIGSGDRDNARDGIRITVAKLQTLREQAVQEKDKDGKLWRSMGFLGGIFIVLLLM